MPACLYSVRSDKEWTTSVEALRGRIDRYMRKITPYRELWYNHHNNGFHARGVNDQAHINTGPYYYRDFSGLARMLGLFTDKNGFQLPLITCIDRKGNEYPEKPLPIALRFPVITPILSDAIRALEAKGYTVTPPIEPDKPLTEKQLVNTFTAPVTEDTRNPNDDPETGEEISEEEIARLLAGPGR
jgi:hypothetical protein